MFERYSIVSTLRGALEFVDYRDIPIIMVSAVKKEYRAGFSLPAGGEPMQGDVYYE